jgi:hypothetical protein
MSKHIRSQRRSNLHTLFFCFGARRTIVALHLVLSKSQKLFNLMKECGRQVVFGAKEFSV